MSKTDPHIPPIEGNCEIIYHMADGTALPCGEESNAVVFNYGLKNPLYACTFCLYQLIGDEAISSFVMSDGLHVKLKYEQWAGDIDTEGLCHHGN